MRIELKKFGVTLVSRQAGKEAYAAFLPTLRETGADEEILVDFSDVNTFTPSWGDEFLTPLFGFGKDHVKLLHTDENASVKLTLEFLEQISGKKFFFGKEIGALGISTSKSGEIASPPAGGSQ